MNDPAFLNWLAGFIDGEGSFHGFYQPNGTPSFQFAIVLRSDDGPILEEIAARTGIGQVRYSPSYPRDRGTNRKPQVTWRVSPLSGCLELVKILDQHPLRAKKKRDYASWRRGVLEWERIRNTGGVHDGGKDWAMAALYVEELRGVRRYELSLLDAFDIAGGLPDTTTKEITNARP